MSGWRGLSLIHQDLRVMEHEADLVAMSREFDDPEWLEWPRDYDVYGTLADLGYAIVPEELRERHYAGPSQLPRHVQRPTWWHRFFGSF